MNDKTIKELLTQKFDGKHVTACLAHFKGATEKYGVEEWDSVALKAGKFVEAVTKALMIFCKKPLPKARDFKAGATLRQLEQVPSADAPDEIRIVIPKACIFIYEVVNNRGGRHDAGDIDANAMDATTILPLMSWIVAEMVRFCSMNGDTDAAMSHISSLIEKKYPFFEDIDGRSYVNIDNLGAPDYALLLLYHTYPSRISRQNLVDSIVRHGVKKSAASMAISRLNCVDDVDGHLKLRGNGRVKAEAVLKRLNDKA